MIIAAAAKMQNNFEKPLSIATPGHSVTHSLTGLIKDEHDLDTEKAKELKAKYGISDEQKE